MSYLPQHLRTREEERIESVQQARIEGWRRRELSSAGDAQWRKALAREHREQEIRLQAATIETARRAAA